MKKFPRTGCSVLVCNQDKVLLIKRGKEPYKGYWSLPGGGQETGETLEACARRELLEETGLRTEALEFVAVRDRITIDEQGNITFHYVLATYLAKSVSGEAKAGDDATELGWFTMSEINRLQTTPDTPSFIAEALGSEPE